MNFAFTGRFDLDNPMKAEQAEVEVETHTSSLTLGLSAQCYSSASRSAVNTKTRD